MTFIISVFVSLYRQKGLTFLLVGIFVLNAKAEPVSNAVPVIDLKLSDYLQQVVQHNESVQAQMLEAEANHYKETGEKGVFEPQFDVSYTREGNERTNNVQQQASQGGQSYFAERNSIYDGGLEELMPLGGKIRLGATMSDLYNNVNPYSSFITLTNNPFIRQYQTFVGATLTQPLLKNGGFSTAMAPIRLAALDSDIAFEQYRRQLMLVIYQAAGAYWNLSYAQEQVHFFDESVSVAQNVLDDARQKMNAGQGSELDVMEAKSALALRQTKRNDALQGYYDALGRLQMLTGVEPDPNHAGSDKPEYRAADTPRTTNAPPDYAVSLEKVFSLNPDYLIQQEKMDQEKVRLGVAANQLLPELDLKAAYGFNGLGTTPKDSWDVAASQNFPSWSVGLELTVPLGGNIKGRNFYKAAKLKWEEAYLNLKDTQTQIASSLSTAIQKARAWQQSIESYQTVVDYNQELLQTELARLKAGTVEAQKVLDVEADLLDSRQSLASALAQYRRALLEIEMSDGAILQDRGFDITRDELRRQTEEILHPNNNVVVQKSSVPPGQFFSPVPAPTQPVSN